MLITRAGRHRVDSVCFFVVIFWFADFALWTLGSRQHVNTRAMESHTGQKWSSFFRVELHNILVEISFQLASFKSTLRESTRSVRECIYGGIK